MKRAGDFIERPPEKLVGVAQMGWRERAWAARLAIRAGWRVDRRDWRYDPVGDVVVVTVPGCGQTWSRVRSEAVETLTEIEASHGHVQRGVAEREASRG